MYELNKQPVTSGGYDVATLARFVLEPNTFELNNKDFRQGSGTGMGTKIAPNYANLFMGELESQSFPECPVKPRIYKRCQTEEELVDFID